MKQIEVECKIKVKDVNEIRNKIKKIARFVKNENKKDEYFSLEYFRYPEKSLRVRDKGKKREVNFKQRINYINGIHAKKEVQFEISDIDGFYDLINDFGFKKWMSKEKKTELYRTKNGVHIELNFVKNLGWFLEIEVLCSEKDVENAREKIVKVREKLGLTMRDVEKKGYTKMFWEREH